MTDVLTRTERLVGVDTAPGSSPSPALALLADELAALGAVVVVQDGERDGVPQRNLLARVGGEGPAGLVLAGHIDTVPWGPDQRATVTPERDGRTLYGRGTCDMKGPIAAQVEAVTAVYERLRRPVVLAFTWGEEVGCHGAQRLMADPRLLGDVAGAVCLVGEPTGLVPIVEHKGYAVARVTLQGVPCHSSDPWAGADASAALGRLLVELHSLRQQWREQAPADSRHAPPCTTLNTGVVAAGSAANMVPARAEVQLEWRPLPGADTQQLRNEVQACLDRACAAQPGVEGVLHWPDPLPAFAQPSAPVVSWLVERTGRPQGVVPFYTEAELYRSGLGLPTVVCGPGSIEKAHRVDESIDFDELEAGVELYRDALLEFCG